MTQFRREGAPQVEALELGSSRGRRAPLLAAAAVVVLTATSPVAASAEDLTFDRSVSATERAEAVRLVKSALGPTVDDLQNPDTVAVAKVDLNADEKPDYVVMINESVFCGTHGCSTMVFLSKGDTHVRVGDFIVHRVGLGSGSTRGVRDLMLGADPARRWAWDGKEYQLAE